jgi:hypothetical protein
MYKYIVLQIPIIILNKNVKSNGHHEPSFRNSVECYLKATVHVYCL